MRLLLKYKTHLILCVLIVGLAVLLSQSGFSQSNSVKDLYDYGDAPAYPFPTARNTLRVPGVVHQANQLIWLGDEITYEARPRPIDNDRKDDAEYTYGVDVNGLAFFEVVVSASNDAPSTGYINVLIDLEGTCTEPDSLGWSQPSNHVVVNRQFNVRQGQQFKVRVPAQRAVDTRDHWMRITVSDLQVSAFSGAATWDGSLKSPLWTGETEDHCQKLQDPTIGITPSEPEERCDCGIVEVTGDGEEILPDSLPISVELSSKEANGVGFVFAEASDQVLNYPPDIFDPKLYSSGNDLVGKQVKSYFLHFDPITSQSGKAINAAGTITVSKCEMIVGLIITDAGLNATDSTLGNISLYPTGLVNRGLEAGNSLTSDTVSIINDGKTVEFNFNATTVVDQVRIITMKIDGCSC